MARSLKKGPFRDHHLTDKLNAVIASGKKHEIIKTWSRRSTILPDMVGHSFGVHNGKKFITVFVSESMVGHKLGEFSETRTFKMHPKKTAAASSASTGS